MIVSPENTEELVFNAVQEYLSNNRVLDKETLINFIKSYFSKKSLNINKEGIIANLESLIKKRRIVEGSKMTKDAILENEKRNRIFNFIKSNPGVYFSEILKEVEMSNHVVYWHVNMLLKFGLIKSTNIQNHDIYYSSKLDEKDVKRLYIIRKAECQKILNYLENNPSGVLKTELSLELEMHPQTIKKYVKYLESFGFIEEKKYSPKEILYFKK